MDPYVYPGTDVLKNLRDIRNQKQLDVAEAISTTRRIRELEGSPVTEKFDTAHLKFIHRYIFQDLYAWAGEFRTVDISKGGHLFGLKQHIAPVLDKTFSDLKKECHLSGADRPHFAKRAAYYLGEINAVHPFREGNGRTQRELIRQLAIHNGFVIEWSRISRVQMIDASRQSFKADNAGLETLLLAAIVST